MIIFIFLFLIPFLISSVSIPFLIRLAKKANLMDISSGDDLKIHKAPMPYLGGVAMIFSFSIGFLFFYFYKNPSESQLWAIVIASVLIFLLGLWDDLNWKHISKTRPITKFIFLIIFSALSAFILFYANIKINFIPFYIISIFLNFLYIFVFINALNYQDGMDGLAAGLSAISLMAFIVIGFIHGNDLSLYFSFVILGGVFGFLVFNFPPAKIFMGDSGAYFLGFVLMVLTALHSESYNILNFIGTMFIVGVPVFDGVITNLRRILSGKSIFWGGRDHFYDILLKQNNSQIKTLSISYGLQSISALIGILFLILSYNI
jgi:UDP-GlcNAc:undecaprenyl-phosphate GlcNAc-1-phosphate transferase